MSKPLKAFGSVALLAWLLTGCANQAKPLYHWGSYQPQVYEYFKGDGNSNEAQIIALEAEVEKARASDAKLPPGYHAHLALLYSKAGRMDQARQQFELEKTLYPESASFMDYLMRNPKK